MILAFDPSGNFHEGKGTTGWVAMDLDGQLLGYGEIDASTALSLEEHWNTHLQIIQTFKDTNPDLIVVCEDYMLYANRAATQINSRFETPKLIGVIQHWCYLNEVKFYLQTAVSVQKRWPNYILEKKGYIAVNHASKGDKFYDVCYIDGHKVVNHIIDALRHAIHFYTFQIRKENLGIENLLSQSRSAE
jgi:hypothetical protein